MREWQKIIGHCVRTIALALILYLGFFFVLTKVSFKGLPLIYYTANYYVWKGGQAFQLFKDFEKEGSKSEAVVLGSSHAYRGYDPRIFETAGLNLFNLGSSGQSIRNTNLLFQEYFHPDLKVVLIDIYAGTFTGDGLESSMDLITNLSREKSAWQIALQLGDFRAMNAFVLRKLQAQKKARYQAKDYVLRGYCSSPKKIARDQQPKSEGVAPNLDFSQQHLQAFSDLLAFLQSKEVNVAILSHPLPKQKKTDLRHEAFRTFIRPILEQYKIPYLDFTQTHDLDTYTHFKDWNHLNQAGVEAYNKLLIQELQQRAIIDGA